jgi:NAD(P)-dependent dehydrogenase (short-subunit alcohol dehydrogenase family)
MLAGFTLCVSMLLADAGAMVATIAPGRWQLRRRQPVATAGRRATYRPQPGGYVRQAPPYRQQQRQRTPRRRLGPSGYLIKIQ